MINYKHEITTLDVDNSNPLTPNLIVGVQVALTATDDTDNISSTVGIYIRLEPSQSFIPIEQLTKEIVESWIADNPMIENAKPRLIEQIESIRTASGIKVITPPWAVTATPSITPLTNFDALPYITIPTIRL